MASSVFSSRRSALVSAAALRRTNPQPIRNPKAVRKPQAAETARPTGVMPRMCAGRESTPAAEFKRLAEHGLRFNRRHRHALRLADPHRLPVVGKFLAALEAYHVCAGQAGAWRGKCRVLSAGLDGNGGPLMRAAK